ncbi:Thioesterase/thiol ester dehydrase-isomerase [Collybia nuda]|uniref:Thioesterase/thiol ester dehydrase-isomerase n=1 Tax=Collybia nuda TaxID=64659 RepID=A0A9P5YBA9_9AGAR|nr:Thioesterase/thiol ester dehydrase-isomerase [Collybia nuda]
MFRSVRFRPGVTNLAVQFQKRPNSSSISKLQAAFRDPSSPFHIPPGSQGPESDPTAPDSATENPPIDPLKEAREKLIASGFDPASFWEQSIAWGDQDPFQHVNNARYARFFESARIRWMISLGHEIGGPEKAKAIIRGQGIGLILKTLEIQFKRPVTYPDTLLVGYRPIPSDDAVKHDLSTFQVTASTYSLTQRAYVAHSKESLVWYDYDRLKKCDPGEAVRGIISRRIKQV